MTQDTGAHPRQDQRVQRLVQAVMASTGDEGLLSRFLREIMSYDEIAAIANRWAVAEMLLSGASQAEAKASLGISTATVSRVAQWVKGPLTVGACAEVYSLLKREREQHRPSDEVTQL